MRPPYASRYSRCVGQTCVNDTSNPIYSLRLLTEPFPVGATLAERFGNEKVLTIVVRIYVSRHIALSQSCLMRFELEYYVPPRFDSVTALLPEDLFPLSHV